VFRLEDAGRRGHEFVNTSVNKTIDEVFAQYEVVASRKQVHLRRGPQEAGVQVMADPPYLKQALINLVDNAIKYRRPAGVVTVSLSVVQHQAEITVEDQGIGISDLDQHRLFSEFFRGQEAQAMTHDGTGLGLVLVKHIIESFGGEVVVKSGLGKGSSFTLKIPVIS